MKNVIIKYKLCISILNEFVNYVKISKFFVGFQTFVGGAEMSRLSFSSDFLLLCVSSCLLNSSCFIIWFWAV